METEIINTDESTTTENTTVTEQDKNEKVFKQADVDKIIADRLSREKASSKKIKEDADSMVAGLNDQITKYEKVLKDVLEKKKAGIPEQYKGLLDKLSLLEQLEFLADPKNQIEKKTVPETPKSESSGQIESKPNKSKFNFI